jgi:hypothetical protein
LSIVPSVAKPTYFLNQALQVRFEVTKLPNPLLLPVPFDVRGDSERLFLPSAARAGAIFRSYAGFGNCNNERIQQPRHFLSFRSFAKQNTENRLKKIHLPLCLHSSLFDTFARDFLTSPTIYMFSLARYAPPLIRWAANADAETQVALV